MRRWSPIPKDVDEPTPPQETSPRRRRRLLAVAAISLVVGAAVCIDPRESYGLSERGKHAATWVGRALAAVYDPVEPRPVATGPAALAPPLEDLTAPSSTDDRGVVTPISFLETKR